MNINQALDRLKGGGAELKAIADAIEAAMREQRFGPLVPPTAGAIAVFETVVMNSPTADMRAIPNQWLLNERALTSKVAEELETEIERLKEKLWEGAEVGDPRPLRETLRERKAEARSHAGEIERLNQMLRDTGYGQGQIDAYVAQCEDLDRLRKALQLAGQRCGEVHHPKHMLHAGNEPCPVEALIESALAAMEDKP